MELLLTYDLFFCRPLLGVGNWSEPSAQTITDIDVPEPLSRPEVMEVNPYSLGISWHAPTASVEGSSINRFVVQLAGAGISYEDKVQQVITWTEGRAYYESYLTRQESLGHLGNDASGQSGENVEILMEAKMARRKRQEIPPPICPMCRQVWCSGVSDGGAERAPLGATYPGANPTIVG